MAGTGLPCGSNCSCEDTGLITYHLAASEAMVPISPQGGAELYIQYHSISPGTGLCSDDGLCSGDAVKSPVLGGRL